ncbi:hypothetical protein [Streptomyces tubercidicus]
MQGRPETADFIARLVDAQIEELRAAGAAEPEVALYVLAPLQDAFLLGRRLADDVQTSLVVMHLSQQAGRSVVPGVVLGSALRAPLGAQQRARVCQLLPVDRAEEPALVAIPETPGQQRHRIAVIVRLASAASMVDDARHVAATGQVSYRTGHHTGYRLPDAGPSGGQSPCGAYLVIDTSSAYLPDDPGLNAAVTTYIWERWQAARRQWAQHLDGATGVEGLLVFHGPLPVALALGWLAARDRLTLVHHDLRLPQGAPPPATAGP